eukprot:CAMPEP_0204407614 /NCGR_PEP_ID=MMETSP0470-20130426/8877_1 /ASSEMBLY_ACC=CAM_ASM_000385 /TAXON_ID=2969 /ORGANISM="Oxyrrhis marina" /LENGTH=89 /DNA_ID=CAMNT_0051403277 /DNA_START=224 /DNA_END=494 /DNA_ORIENTATION=+
MDRRQKRGYRLPQPPAPHLTGTRQGGLAARRGASPRPTQTQMSCAFGWGPSDAVRAHHMRRDRDAAVNLGVGPASSELRGAEHGAARLE